MPAQWDLTLLFKSDTDPAIKAYLAQARQQADRFIKRWAKRQDYLSDAAVLKQALDQYDQFLTNYGFSNRAEYYFWLRLETNQNDPKIKAHLNQVDEFQRQISTDLQFFELKLAKIPTAQQTKLLRHPQLQNYRHFLERLFAQAQYLLSEPEEKVLTLKSKASHSDWVQMVAGLISKEQRQIIGPQGKKIQATFSQLEGLVSNPKKATRDSTAAAISDILQQHIEVAEAEINAIMGNKKVDDQLRHYPRPDSGRHLADDIDSQTVDQLVQAVSQRFKIAREYYQLKAKLLKVPKLQYHERNLEYGQTNRQYRFSQAVDLVDRALSQLDPQFSQIFRQMVENKQIDVYPQAGKRGGAFCAHGLISDPVYVLLNYNNQLRDVLTLAHEFGHAINDELMRQAQTAINFDAPLSTAEVASTFMEDFVLQQILAEADDQLRLSVMMMKLNDDISTIFRQIAFYRFESDLHQQFRQQGYLSHQTIGQLFRQHMKSYIGSAVEYNPGTENWWAYVPHFRSFFYVYSYASGLLISKALQQRVKQDPTFINQVKQFLGTGLSASPKDTFAQLGIDINDQQFWLSGLEEIGQLLKETKQLAKKLALL